MNIIASQNVPVKLVPVALLSALVLIFSVSFGQRSLGRGAEQYTKDELRIFLERALGKIDGYISDLREGYNEAREAGEEKLANSIGDLLKRAEEERRLIEKLRRRLDNLTEEQIDAYLKKIFIDGSVIKDSSIPSAARVFAQRAAELERGWLTRKYAPQIKEYVRIFGQVRAELDSILNEIKRFLLGNLKPDQPSPKLPPPSPEPPPPLEPPPKSSVPERELIKRLVENIIIENAGGGRLDIKVEVWDASSRTWGVRVKICNEDGSCQIEEFYIAKGWSDWRWLYSFLGWELRGAPAPGLIRQPARPRLPSREPMTNNKSRPAPPSREPKRPSFRVYPKDFSP